MLIVVQYSHVVTNDRQHVDSTAVVVKVKAFLGHSSFTNSSLDETVTDEEFTQANNYSREVKRERENFGGSAYRAKAHNDDCGPKENRERFLEFFKRELKSSWLDETIVTLPIDTMAGGSVDISGVSYDGKQATLQKVEKDVTLTDDPLMIQTKSKGEAFVQIHA